MTTLPKSYADLFNARGVAILTTNGPTGYPQTTAVAYMLDDDGLLKISLNTTRQKTKNLQRDPRATLFFLDPANPYRTIEIRANVELVPDVDKAFAVRAGARYGSDFLRHDKPGEERVIVILHPVRVNTWGDKTA
jgi:PPOX class probable F420-dependent enzyme